MSLRSTSTLRPDQPGKRSWRAMNWRHCSTFLSPSVSTTFTFQTERTPPPQPFSRSLFDTRDAKFNRVVELLFSHFFTGRCSQCWGPNLQRLQSGNTLPFWTCAKSAKNLYEAIYAWLKCNLLSECTVWRLLSLNNMQSWVNQCEPNFWSFLALFAEMLLQRIDLSSCWELIVNKLELYFAEQRVFWTGGFELNWSLYIFPPLTLCVSFKIGIRPTPAAACDATPKWFIYELKSFVEIFFMTTDRSLCLHRLQH